MRSFHLRDDVKKNLIIFAIFFGIVFGITVLLVTMTLASRSSWKNGLAEDVQLVLNDYPENAYTVGKYLPLNSTFSTSAAVYSLLKKDDARNESHYGVIVRIPSILGPLPAVFIYSERSGVHFAGYAVDAGKASQTVTLELSSTVMKYWESMIPKIVAKTTVK